MSAIEPVSQPPTAPPRWRVLLVDDEPSVHEVSRLVLGPLQFDGREVEFLSAFSGAEARTLLAQHPDIALVLLDVVMESDDAGLRLVPFVREVLGNAHMQIVLRTGQPGRAPEWEVVRRDEINGYCLKTELTAQRLRSIVIAALRTFRNAGAPGPQAAVPSVLPARPQDAARQALARALSESRLDEQLLLQAQPIVALATQAMAGVELLVHWRTEQGLLPMDRVADALPEGEAGQSVVRWLLAQAAHWAAQWRSQCGRPVPVSVPLLGDRLDDCSVQALIHEALQSRMPQGTLDLLIGDEGARRLEASPAARDALAQLRSAGVTVTRVDFSADTIALARLRTLAPERLRIHRQMVQQVDLDTGRMDLARSVIALAQTLQITTLAEGVDRDAEAQFLRWEGCELGQGNALVPPGAPEDVGRWLRGEGPPKAH